MYKPRHANGMSQFSKFCLVLGFIGAFVLMCIAVPNTAHAEGAQPYATVSDVSCVDGNGQLSTTLNPGSQATKPVEFIIMVDDSSWGDGEVWLVNPGQTRTVDVAGLEDGVHTLEIWAQDVVIVPKRNVTIACDSAPGGDYTNPKAKIFDLCDGIASVQTSNYPIVNDLEHLQTVNFVITAKDEAGKTVATELFPLPIQGEDDAFDNIWEYKFDTMSGIYTITVKADNKTIATGEINTACVVVDGGGTLSPNNPGHSSQPQPTVLPNTGMSTNLWLGAFALMLVAVGSVLVWRSRLVSE